MSSIKVNNHSFWLTSFIGIWLIFCFANCLSEIQVDIPKNNLPNIAITGNLVLGDPSKVTVGITNLANFNGVDPPVPIADALVSIFDDLGNVLNIPPTKPGLYELSLPKGFPAFTVDIGRSYQIAVIANNKQYASTLEPILAVPKATQLSVVPIIREELNSVGNITDQTYLQFFLDTPIESPRQGKISLKWDFEGVYRFIETTLDVPIPIDPRICYFTETLNLDKITVFNAVESRQSSLVGEFLFETRLNHRFISGYYLNVFQQSLSENALKYWERIGGITDLSGNFFEAPPGKVIGNIVNIDDPEEAVFGYFYATEVDTIRLFIPVGEFRPTRICPSLAIPNDIRQSQETKQRGLSPNIPCPTLLFYV